ncbi:NAD(P)-dependent alcohol dehydrogenase [Saccharopolyspora erythraea]|uniref:NAD(P)-dependent alcohol dehydrogenase n=1 Tax=Saccharopolyspora erythraea TaxID=1836 RepID=UPI001BA54B4F|nr:NAD(P)-dependent alcohol dehydrogenase [Saccharopolyspora erythraea]QUH00193.1 NAD(P)-dependent alcohol dehydrogenase [Saccharopolyspora erythraea]
MIPEKMRASVLRGVGDVVVQERPVPEPGPHEVLVRVTAVGTCGSDTHYYEHGRIGPFVVREPLVLGHEAAGVVVARGAEVSRHEPGQRVSIEPGVPCFVCAQCRAGRYNLCPDVRFFATPPVDGAFCEYVAVHEEFAYAVPDSMTDEAAALCEPLSVGVWACRKGGVGPGSRVLVTGAGPIGLVATQTARAFGASEVVVTDVNPRRLELASELGATGTVDVRESAIDFEPEVLLECSGAPRAAADAIRRVTRAGRVVLVGMGGDELPLPLSHVQNFEIEVTGTFRYANTWPAAIAIAASGAVDLDRLVTHRFGLAEVEQALTASARDETAVKTVVRPQE